MNNEELLEKVGKLIDTKLEPIKNDLATVKYDLTTVKTDLHNLTETMNESFQETWARMDVENSRITRLEEAADLTHRN